MGPGLPGVQLWRCHDDGRLVGGSSEASAASGAGGGGADVESWFLASSVGFAVEDEFVGGGLESVDADWASNASAIWPSHSMG